MPADPGRTGRAGVRAVAGRPPWCDREDGGALEQLAAARVLLLDKTGTLTTGQPSVADVVTSGAFTADEVLALAASVDQVSPHVLAAPIVQAARERGLALQLPADVTEVAGKGIRGRVGDRTVAVGQSAE